MPIPIGKAIAIPAISIAFDLINDGQSTLIVYNLLGKKINTLINVSLNAGHHSIEWNGFDYNGQSVASGVYFYELRSGGFIAKKKMLLLR